MKQFEGVQNQAIHQDQIRNEDYHGPLMIDNINIHVKSKRTMRGQAQEVIYNLSQIDLDDKLKRDQDEANYMDSHEQNASKRLIEQRALLINDGSDQINTQEFKMPLLQNKQNSYYSTFSGQKYYIAREESQQCNLDSQGGQSLDQQSRNMKS
ncbi:UNKNOWN [Stylonychia lemnae]|uniref:Uncharacterized protein n=1 Tax=Stylonychia lemnae TaxID=5949 RepID=A0A078A8S0_STYLE|nr:UNKNOWN [Stylonychia lemnae]|eukprot:CDW78276.1 UNKNOWN [Stylonychia lemnae]